MKVIKANCKNQVANQCEKVCGYIRVCRSEAAAQDVLETCTTLLEELEDLSMKLLDLQKGKSAMNLRLPPR